MIVKAYIHEYGNGKLEPEHQDVKTVLESRGINCELFTTKRLHRNQLQLDQNTLVVGDHPTMQMVFKRLGFVTNFSSYPMSLHAFMHRGIWETTITALLNESRSKEITAVFVKPKLKAKLFTGFVIHSNDDLFPLFDLAGKTALSVSEVVNWVSEFRIFVNAGNIVGVQHYSGDSSVELNMTHVENAIAAFENSSERTAGYCLDFGVLDTGETALVEWNDGYSLGSYGLNNEIYTDLLITRWTEIVGN